MVFVYKPEGRASCAMTREISYWFAKQDFKHMLQEEKDFLKKLNTWRPVEKWKVTQFYLQRVQTEQKTLMALIRFSLGWETDILSISVHCD